MLCRWLKKLNNQITKRSWQNEREDLKAFEKVSVV